MPPAGVPLQTEYANYVTTLIELEDLKSGLYRTLLLTLKAPSQPKHYTLAYRLFCEGFDSAYEEFEVVVDEPEIPS